MTVSRVVLADTGPLYAVVDRSDHYHAQAQRDLAEITRRRLRVLIAESTLLETHRLVLHNLGIARSRTWLQQVRVGLARVVLDRDDYERAVDTVLRFSDQDLTLFDTLLLAVSARRDAPIWTYDHHFDILRANRWQP
jgi:uncharacterized protein